ncbi:MAG: hypothetical protein JRD89_21095, partial [Deltaproteobacteria bacterium]|nr:hypothetical protein [Deltaproteobacteria bacterium]MBW2675864.1 hypothetical protein [Deltaproteobacteria bacterium]
MAYLEAILNLIESSGGQMSFAEIGRRLGISREWVRRLARRAGSDAGRVKFTCEVCGSNVIIGRREKEILQLV